MSTYAIWFEDLTRNPQLLPGCTPARGLPAAWLNPLLGLAKVRQVCLLPEDIEVVTGFLVDVPDYVDEQFRMVFMGAAERLGTIATIRDYHEPAYQQAWDSQSSRWSSNEFTARSFLP